MQLVKTLIPIFWFLIIALGQKVSGLGLLGTALTSNELDIDNHLCKAENIKVNEYICSRITKGQSQKLCGYCVNLATQSFTLHSYLAQP